MSSQSPEDIEADIEQQREQLAETVDALTAKLDVKHQAQAKVTEAKEQATAKVAEVKDKATTDTGKPRPELLVFGATVVVVAVAIVVWRRR